MHYFYSQAHKTRRLILVIAMLWLPVIAQANCLLMMNMSHGTATEQSWSESVKGTSKTLTQNMHSSHQPVDMQPVSDTLDNATAKSATPHHGQDQAQSCDGECFNCASCAPALSSGHTYRPALSIAVERRLYLVEPFTGKQSPPFRPPIS